MPSPRQRTGDIYFAISYVLVLASASRFVLFAPPAELSSVLFAAAAYPTYAAAYLLPIVVLTKLTWRLGGTRGWWVGDAVAVLGVALVHLLLIVDHAVFALYGFHLNGFVWNLITTPGGLASLGGETVTMLTAATVTVATVALQGLLLAALARFHRPIRWNAGGFGARRYALLVVAFVVMSLGEHVAYAVSLINGNTAVLSVAEAIPAYVPVTVWNLAAKLGVAPKGRAEGQPDRAITLNYPAEPLAITRPAAPDNVVWLVAESLRGDMLEPDVMPNLWAFSQRAIRFTHHYSGGNGTRTGMFSMFYGLYGNYWMPMLRARRSPVLMDTVQALDYQLLLQTSARFTYPEFDLTIFARVPRDAMHEESREKYGWQRDRLNVDRMIRWLDQRDRGRPFFVFQFFESPHAAYFFPDDAVIRRPYLETLNYATMNVARDIELIRNRYVNAVHHLDQQLGRVFTALEAQGLLGRTIVVVTGDHGEEFLEKGRWGHNSQLSREQLHVPLVLWVPGQAANVVDRLTSHVDVAPTLMPLLGVRSPARSYSLGESLLTGPPRTFVVFSDWNRIAYMDHRYKLQFPLLPGTLLIKTPVTDVDDRPIGDAPAVSAEHRAAILEMLRDMGRFGTRRSSRSAPRGS